MFYGHQYTHVHGENEWYSVGAVLTVRAARAGIFKHVYYLYHDKLWRMKSPSPCRNRYSAFNAGSVESEHSCNKPFGHLKTWQLCKEAHT